MALIANVLLLLLSLGLAACNDSNRPVESLPADRQLALPGAPADVRIIRDDRGFAHIYGKGLAAVLYGQGYVTAADRFWQMDMFRKVARGRLGRYLGIGGDIGADVLAADVEMRTLMLTRDGRFLEDALVDHIRSNDPETFALIEAYVAGVNAWIADMQAERNGAELPREYDYFLLALEPEDIEPWSAADVLAIARLQAAGLSRSDSDEIQLAAIRAALKPEVFRDLFRWQPPSPAQTLSSTPTAVTPTADGAAIAGKRPPQARDASAPQLGTAARKVARALAAAAKRTRALNPLAGGENLGSNNWIVGPTRSASGNAMLANDPHLQLFNPPIWHVVHLDPTLDGGPGIPVAGVQFPGLPGVILGYNRHIAWGGTVAGYDVTDVYLEVVTGSGTNTSVVYRGTTVPVLRIEAEFVQKNGDVVTVPIDVVPHHGPQVPDPDPSDEVVGLAAGGNMTIRWTGHELTNDPAFLLGINQARSVEEALEAIRKFSVGAQNWVIADDRGNIAYFPFALVPQRPAGVVPYLPVTGTGEAEWLTDANGNVLWLSEQDLPHAINPAAGYLATANNDLIGTLQDNDPLNDDVYLYADRSPGYRQERILELLAADDSLTLAELGAIQHDIHSKEAAYLLPHLFAAANSGALSPAAADLLERLRVWYNDDITPLATAAGIDPASVREDFSVTTTPPSSNDQADAVATSIFYAWLGNVVYGTFADELAAAGVDVPSGEGASRALWHLLEHVGASDDGNRIWTAGPDGQSTLWDNRTTPVTETRTFVLLDALERAVTDLTLAFGNNDPNTWLWGKIHFVQLEHFLAAVPTSDFDLGVDPRVPAAGGRFTVSPSNFSLAAAIRETTATTGASERFIVELTPDGPVAYNAIPGGQSGIAGDDYDRIDPELHYGDSFDEWATFQRFRHYFNDAEVAAHAREVWDIRASK